MISYDFVPISSQKGVLFLRHPVVCEYDETHASLVALLFIACLIFGFQLILKLC